MSTWPKPWLTASPGRLCPTCKTPTGRPIVMGLPGPDLIEAIERGVIAVSLGGCCVRGDDPTHECSACGARFGAPRRAKPGTGA